MYFAKLVLRNALRHKLRSGLTVLGIFVAILAFGLLRTVVEAWFAGAEGASNTRLITRNSISLVFTLPIAYRDRIRQVGGVASVSHANWFGGIYVSEKNFFPQFAVDAKSYLDLYPEYLVPPEQMKAFLLDRKGCVVGRKLADIHGFKVGDVVQLRGTIFPGTWEFVVRAIYDGAEPATDTSQFLFHWDYLNETLTETEKAFQLGFVAMTEAIVIAIQIVSFLVIFIIMAVMANTMAMTARERMSEYATMKALGFGPARVVTLIFGESLSIALVGAAAAVLATFPVAEWFAGKVGTLFPVFSVSRQTVEMQVMAAVVVGAVAALLPSYRAASVRIVDGLRNIG